MEGEQYFAINPGNNSEECCNNIVVPPQSFT